MEKVKILHFWPCQESNWAISCQNRKTPLQIFYMLYNAWETTRKLIESWKNIWGKSTHFCLGPKMEMDTETLISHYGQIFMCFVVQFHENFRFWYQTGNVPDKVYAVIWSPLDTSSLDVWGFTSSIWFFHSVTQVLKGKLGRLAIIRK